MGPNGAPEGSTSNPPELVAFRKLIARCDKCKLNETQQKFMKKMDSIPTVALSAKETCRLALNLADRGLIGQFTSLWPSPKATEGWVHRNWRPLVSAEIRSHFVGRGFFVFVFYYVEDRDLIFRNSPYFMGPQGIYFNKWTPDFDPTQDISSAVPVWVRLPHLPLHYWSLESLEIIGNKLGKFTDRAKRKDRFSYVRICVEFDLEIGLPEAIQLTIADWSYV